MKLGSKKFFKTKDLYCGMSMGLSSLGGIFSAFETFGRASASAIEGNIYLVHVIQCKRWILPNFTIGAGPIPC